MALLSGRAAVPTLAVVLCTVLQSPVDAKGIHPRKLSDDLDQSAAEFLLSWEQRSQEHYNEYMTSKWNWDNNITEETELIKNEVGEKYARFQKERWTEVVQWDWQALSDPSVRLQFRLLSKLGVAALSAEDYKLFTKHTNNMSSTFSSAKICSYQDPENCDLTLNKDLRAIMAYSEDPGELAHVWTKFRDATGKKMREDYIANVAYMNKAAVANNFANAAEMWLSEYVTDSFSSDQFRDQVDRLWEQAKPLYQQLHAYVLGKLREKFGEDVVGNDGLIPAYLMGDMWGTFWSNLFDLVKPYPEKSTIDVTEEMKAQGYTARTMFELSEEFFTSLGLGKMTDKFWKNSIIEHPADGRQMNCWSSAWDMGSADRQDFRIRQCSHVNNEYLRSTHHEMGHVQYYMEYADQPIIFRRGANPGFHEAVGDVISLSVQTPKHLQVVGLLSDTANIDDKEVDMNFLMLFALQKVASLPQTYVVDKWRWAVFSGDIPVDQMNSAWWKLRETEQGFKPPQPRTEDDFDPGALFHIGANVPYVRYFVAQILQFQFHKALCAEAGEYDPSDPAKPLHQCDIYRSHAAGDKLREMLKLGRSVPWPDALEKITGEREINASAILEYFAPLMEWLKKRNGDAVGW